MLKEENAELLINGKRDDISLREKETQIKKDLNDGIDTAGGKMTVCQGLSLTKM